MIDSSVNGQPAMRHVPPVEYLIFKVDVDYRSRIEKLLRAYEEVCGRLDPEPRQALESGFTSLAVAIERLAELLRATRTFHPDDIRGRIDTALANATHALLATSSDTFRNRAPLEQFERAVGEYALAAFLVIAVEVRSLSEAVGKVAPEVWEELLADTAAAELRAPREALQPIA